MTIAAERLKAAADAAVAALAPAEPVAFQDGPLDGIPFTIPLLALTDTMTGDKRIVREFTLAPVPMPFKVIFEDGGDGHENAIICGKLTEVTMAADGDRTLVSAAGVYAMNEAGVQAAMLAASDMLTSVSFDGDSAEVELMADGTLDYKTARIRGATQCAIGAFVETRVVVDPADIDRMLGMVASGGVPADIVGEFADDTFKPPVEWFDNPKLTRPTALTYRNEGGQVRVFGHLALDDSCHTTVYSETGTCMNPPESLSGYRYFNTGQIECAGGRTLDGVGVLTFGTGHAAKVRMTPNGEQEIIPASAAVEHYTHTGHIGAYVRAGSDEFGTWIAGWLEPGLTAREKRAMLAAKVSGDWRQVAGNLELIGALAVPKPAFPVPSLAIAAGGECVALVAAGAVPDDVLPAEGDASEELAKLYPLLADFAVAQLE